jgi:hypothetical protein
MARAAVCGDARATGLTVLAELLESSKIEKAVSAPLDFRFRSSPCDGRKLAGGMIMVGSLLPERRWDLGERPGGLQEA